MEDLERLAEKALMEATDEARSAWAIAYARQLAAQDDLPPPLSMSNCQLPHEALEELANLFRSEEEGADGGDWLKVKVERLLERATGSVATETDTLQAHPVDDGMTISRR